MQVIYFKALIAICLLLASCSTTPKISSEFIATGGNVPASQLEEIMNSHQVERHVLDGLAFQVTNDQTHLYILIDFISFRLYEKAINFGFTLYLDHKNGFRHSFGVSYPTGLYYELGNFPNAQKGYLEEPNWENLQDNRSIAETARRTSLQNTLLIQRSSRRDPIHPVPVRHSQLQAQSLFLHFQEDGRSGRIAYAIPLQTTPTSQFSPDILPGESLNVGFEINPSVLFGLDPRGRPTRISGQASTAQTSAQEEIEERYWLLMRRLGEPFEEKAEVRIARTDSD